LDAQDVGGVRGQEGLFSPAGAFRKDPGGWMVS